MTSSVKKVLSIVSLCLAALLMLGILVASVFPLVQIEVTDMRPDRYTEGVFTGEAPFMAELSIGWSTAYAAVVHWNDIYTVINLQERKHNLDARMEYLEKEMMELLADSLQGGDNTYRLEALSEKIESAEADMAAWQNDLDALSDSDRERIEEKLADPAFVEVLSLYYAVRGYVDGIVEKMTDDDPTIESGYRDTHDELRDELNEMWESADLSDEGLRQFYLLADAAHGSPDAEGLMNENLEDMIFGLSFILFLLTAIGAVLLPVAMVVLVIVLLVRFVRTMGSIIRGLKNPTPETVVAVMSNRSLIGTLSAVFTSYVCLSLGLSGAVHMGDGMIALLIVAAIYGAVRLVWAFLAPVESPVRVGVKQMISLITCILSFFMLQAALTVAMPASFEGSYRAYADAIYEEKFEDAYTDQYEAYRERDGIALHEMSMLPSHAAAVRTADTLNKEINGTLVTYFLALLLLLFVLTRVAAGMFLRLFDRAAMQGKHTQQDDAAPQGAKWISGLVALALILLLSFMTVTTLDARNDALDPSADNSFPPFAVLLGEYRAQLADEDEEWQEQLDENMENMKDDLDDYLDDLLDEYDEDDVEYRTAALAAEQRLLYARNTVARVTADQGGALETLRTLCIIIVVLELCYFIVPRFIPKELLMPKASDDATLTEEDKKSLDVVNNEADTASATADAILTDAVQKEVAQEEVAQEVVAQEEVAQEVVAQEEVEQPEPTPEAIDTNTQI